MPMPIGSRFGCLTFAGMISRPRAISLRTSSGSTFSRVATYAISSVTMPFRAKCICVTTGPLRFETHSVRMGSTLRPSPVRRQE